MEGGPTGLGTWPSRLEVQRKRETCCLIFCPIQKWGVCVHSQKYKKHREKAKDRAGGSLCPPPELREM